jgi:uncharacterized SAM-binding protein YcdF (DUF218 family)
MMHALETAAAFFKFALRPASVGFVVIALGVGVMLTWSRRMWRVAPFYWVLLFAGYASMATPVVADWLVEQTSGGFPRIERAADAQNVRTIVVLGSGSRTFRDGPQAFDVPTPPTVIRTMEGARLYHLLGSPTVILSGGVTDHETPEARPESESMRAVILRLGVPQERLVLESMSTTTRSEADAVRGILGAHRTEPILLVTSPTHMRRSLAVFEAEGMKPIAAVARSRSDRSPSACRWCPTRDALDLSDSVVYEQVAWVYYWTHGWLTPEKNPPSQKSTVNSQ